MLGFWDRRLQVQALTTSFLRNLVSVRSPDTIRSSTGGSPAWIQRILYERSISSRHEIRFPSTETQHNRHPRMFLALASRKPTHPIAPKRILIKTIKRQTITTTTTTENSNMRSMSKLYLQRSFQLLDSQHHIGCLREIETAFRSRVQRSIPLKRCSAKRVGEETIEICLEFRGVKGWPATIHEAAAAIAGRKDLILVESKW